MRPAATSGWEITWRVIFYYYNIFTTPKRRYLNQSSALAPTSLYAGLHTRASGTLFPWAGGTGALSRQLALPGAHSQVPPGQRRRARRGHSLWGHGRVLPVQHAVGGLAGAAQAAQEGLQLDQAADTRDVCEPHALTHSAKGPDRHSGLGMASLFKPTGRAGELREFQSPFRKPCWDANGTVVPALVSSSYWGRAFT